MPEDCNRHMLELKRIAHRLTKIGDMQRRQADLPDIVEESEPIAAAMRRLQTGFLRSFVKSTWEAQLFKAQWMVRNRRANARSKDC